MNDTAQPSTNGVSRTVWLGRGMSGLFILFMLGASITPKFFLPQVSHPTMTELGWSPKFTLLIGTIELLGTLLYAIPRTALLGAVLLTGLLGGSLATQLRVENPLFSHIVQRLPWLVHVGRSVAAQCSSTSIAPATGQVAIQEECVDR